MTTIILHFGMNKTGSSSIQRFLAGLVPTRTYRYADLGTPNQSLCLVAAFTTDSDRGSSIVKARIGGEQLSADGRRYRSLIDSEITSAEAETLIFSGEGVRLLTEPELMTLHRTFRSVDNEVRAVGYVRAPQGFIESNFQQILKRRLVDFRPADLYPKYRQRFAKLEHVFGQDNVQYWPFEPEKFPQRCVVHDFCARTGIDIGDHVVVRANKSLSRQALGILYAYRKFGPQFTGGPNVDGSSNLLIRHLRELKGDKLQLGRSIMAPVLEQYEKDIAWMERRLGVPFPAAGGTGPDAVNGEEDLLRFDERTLSWLANALGPEYVDKCRPDMSPKLVADWTEQLRLRLVSSGPVRDRRPRAGTDKMGAMASDSDEV